jgi:hypothetical protein
VAELGLPQTFEPGEMVASLIVTGWLLDGAPGGHAIELDGREEVAIVDEIGRLAGSWTTCPDERVKPRLTPGRAAPASG